MREYVGDDAWNAAPRRPRASTRGGAPTSAWHCVEVVRPLAWSAPRSCRRGAPWAAACAPARGRRRARPRRRRPGAAALPFRRLDRKRLRVAAQPGRAGIASTDRARRPASSACRWWRRGPSAPGRNRRHARPATRFSARPRIRAFAAGSSSSTANSRATTRSMLPSTGAALRAERDRRDGGRRVGADPRKRASARSRSAGNIRHGARSPPWRRRAGCGRGRSSRARPTAAARRRAAPRPAPRTFGQRAMKRAK